MSDVKEFITKKGTIDGLMALKQNGELTQGEIKQQMNVANGTIQRRLDEMKSMNWVDEDASLGETGRPQKVYRLTDEGSERAEKLRELLE